MLKISFIGIFSLLALNSCSPTSSDTSAKVSVDENATCVPESKLMAKGIIGGKRINPTDKDSTTVAMVLSRKKKDAGICTGTLIGPKLLLTAAHCIKASADETLIVFYSAISCESGFDSTKNSQRVSKVIVHKDYVPSEKTKEGINDIALIILQDPAPVNYPIYKIADPAKLKDSRLYFYGYGVTGSNEGGAGILRKTSFSRNDFSVEKENNKIRVQQDNGTGICSGDSGGPGFVNIDGEAQILGVNSFVKGPEDDFCNGTSTLALAYSYKEWIQDAMKKNRY